MKKIFYFLSLAAAAAFTLTSCQEEIKPHEPGEPDSADCYGVYFPAQEASGSHVYNPTQDKVIDITVARTNTKGAITVPIQASYSEDGIFQPGEAKFADGQKETTLKVRFDKAKEGVNYAASFVITDPAYASKYNANPIGLDFDVLCVEMKYFKADESQAEPTVVHWQQPWWGEAVDTYIKYYEVDGIRTCFTETLTSTHLYKGEYYDGFGFWGASAAEGEGEWSFLWYTKDTDDAGNQYIQLLSQFTGYHHSSYDTDVWVYDGWGMDADYSGKKSEMDSWLASVKKGTYNYSYYDGNGGFFLYTEWYYMTGVGGWHVAAIDNYGIAEGFTRVDYTLKGLESDYAYDGVSPVYVYTGVDVTKVGVVAVAGELTATQIGNQAAAIGAGTAEGMLTVSEFVDVTYKEEEVKGAVVEIPLAETGVYTVVAVTFDKDGNAFDSGSILIQHVADGDEETMAVDITCGIGSAAKYAGQGVNTDSSLEAWLYGSNIVSAKIAAAKFVDLVANLDGVLDALDAATPLSAAEIAAVNDGGFVGVVTGLLPGTEYYLVVWASNGYEEDYFLSEGSCFTTGDPLPIYQDFSAGSYAEEYELAEAKDWYGKWNYYAVDYYGETGLREYIGPVTISASETPTEGPDDYGLYDEYVYVDGLFGDLDQYKAYGYDLTGLFEMDVYSGLMYSCNNTNVAGDCNVHIYSKGAAGWYDYAQAYFSAFIPVMDGYYAFVDCSQYADSYNFCGLRILSDYVWNAYYDLLLIDPAKDDNGLAPSAVNAAVTRARKLISESAAEVDNNLVLNNKARARAIIDTYMQKQQACSIFDNVKPVNGTCPVKTVKVQASTREIPAVAGKKMSKTDNILVF